MLNKVELSVINLDIFQEILSIVLTFADDERIDINIREEYKQNILDLIAK